MSNVPLALGILVGALVLTLPAGEPVRLDGRTTGAHLGAGVLFGVGNLALLALVARVGTGTGFTIAQLSLIVNAGVGIWVFHAPPRAPGRPARCWPASCWPGSAAAPSPRCDRRRQGDAVAGPGGGVRSCCCSRSRWRHRMASRPEAAEMEADDRDRIRADLGSVLPGPGGALGSADRLCRACVELLPVDGAAISVTYEGISQGTFGSSGDLSRRLDEFQFTLGEGPCLEAATIGQPVLVDDVRKAEARRWPAFSRALLDEGVRAVFALPVEIARTRVGALDLFRLRPGPLTEEALHGGLWAAELAALPLLDLMTADVDWAAVAESSDGWDQLASLERVEVYQATGMVVAQLEIDAAEALVRLRAYAFAQGITASEAAWRIVERRVFLADDAAPGPA